MHIGGLLVGIFTFLIIGAFHGVVVKTEYYFSKRVWAQMRAWESPTREITN